MIMWFIHFTYKHSSFQSHDSMHAMWPSPFIMSLYYIITHDYQHCVSAIMTEMVILQSICDIILDRFYPLIDAQTFLHSQECNSSIKTSSSLFLYSWTTYQTYHISGGLSWALIHFCPEVSLAIVFLAVHFSCQQFIPHNCAITSSWASCIFSLSFVDTSPMSPSASIWAFVHHEALCFLQASGWVLYETEWVVWLPEENECMLCMNHDVSWNDSEWTLFILVSRDCGLGIHSCLSCQSLKGRLAAE